MRQLTALVCAGMLWRSGALLAQQPPNLVANGHFEADTDGDGVSDGDEAWHTHGNPTDSLKISGEDQYGLGEAQQAQSWYWVAARIVAGGEESPLSNCVYIGPPLAVEYGSWWSCTGLLNSHAAWGDFDGDGDLDLAVCGESDSGLGISERDPAQLPDHILEDVGRHQLQ